jgi:hypothetical protein
MNEFTHLSSRTDPGRLANMLNATDLLGNPALGES